MVNSKLLGEKRSDACEDIHIAQATQKKGITTENIAGKKNL